jgi:crotonobetainyl-CoA:carnitine CoA-transferase CaiB-like acyl-CoA transferase
MITIALGNKQRERSGGTMPFPALLAGVRILDTSRVLAGPFAGQMLGDLGAEVIKIERPGVGDDTREWGPPFVAPRTSAYYLSCNRNKRGLTLDLGHPEGRAVFHRLLPQTDVVLENYLPKSAEKLGLTPNQLWAVNPRLIVCSISGFGRTGPLAQQAGYDLMIQAMSGLMSITGQPGGEPTKVGVAIADVLTGLYAASSILACLVARGRTGQGYAIDLALFDCTVAAQVNLMQAYLTRINQGVPPEEAAPGLQGNAHSQIVPYQSFATADGYIVVAVGNDSQWKRFCAIVDPALDEPGYATNPQRVRQRTILEGRIQKAMRERETRQWVEQLQAGGIVCAPVLKYADMFIQKQMAERGLRVRVRDCQGQELDLLGSPIHINDATPPVGYPPSEGQDNAAILESLAGYSPQEIEALRQQGIV